MPYKKVAQLTIRHNYSLIEIEETFNAKSFFYLVVFLIAKVKMKFGLFIVVVLYGAQVRFLFDIFLSFERFRWI